MNMDFGGEGGLVKAGKLGHLVLSVSDCVRSRDFYTKLLGLKISSENLSRGQVFLTLGEEHHVLALFQRATEAPPTPDQPGVVHIAFQLDSLDELQAATKELKEAGVAIESEAEDHVTRGFYVRDPDNYCIEVFCNRTGDELRSIGTSELGTAPRDIAAGDVRRH
jgi:lactoylglutathione lyase